MYIFTYLHSILGKRVIVFCLNCIGRSVLLLSVVHNTAIFASGHHANQLVEILYDLMERTCDFSGVTCNISTPVSENSTHSRLCIQTNPYIIDLL